MLLMFSLTAQELWCCLCGCTAVPQELRGRWVCAVLCWQPGLSTEPSPLPTGSQESSAAGGSQLHSCLGMRAQSPGDGHFRQQDAETWLCRSQVPWENTPVTITSSKNCQTSLGNLFQLNTLPRRAVRDQTTDSLLPTLTTRKDKINCF